MNIDGKTRIYAVLGHPIEHTLSPAMHNASIRTLGIPALYVAFDVAPERLMKVLPAMQDMGFGGVNLTVPLKEIAFRGLTDLDDSARLLGAVNTVEFRPDGILRGHNTDGAGFLAALQEAFGLSCKGISLFVIGSGGAGRAVALVAASAGAAAVTVADVLPEKASALATEITTRFPKVQAKALPADKATWNKEAAQCALVAQCSTAGMKPTDESPLTSSAFHQGQYLFDLVYMQPETVTMKVAASAGARTSNGLGMLLHQGARSFRIWTGLEPDTASMKQALQEHVYGRKNG